MGQSDIHKNRINKENNAIHQTRSQHEKYPPAQSKNNKSTEKDKISIMTESTKKSQDKSTPSKISRTKIVNLVNNNDSELEEMLYNSITEMEKEMMNFENINDIARENKLLKNSVTKLKQILK